MDGNRILITILLIVLGGFSAGVVTIFLQEHTATASLSMQEAVNAEFIKDSVRMDPESLDTLNSNCITRDYTIKLLSRIVDLQHVVRATPEQVRRGRDIVGGISRCSGRDVSLDNVHLGKWVMASRTVDVTDPRLYDALMQEDDMWGVDDEPLDVRIKKKLDPLKDGPPTRAKLTTLETLHAQHPEQKNVIYNLFRFYIALREYESYRRFVREPDVKKLLVRERQNALLSPYYDFDALAGAEATPRSRYMRAAFYFLHGDVDNAEAECATALEIYPDRAAFHFLRALALHGQGRQDLAIEAADRAVQLDSANTTFRQARAIINDSFDKPRLRHPVTLCYHRVTSEYSLETATATPQQLETHLKYVKDQNLADARVCAPASEKPPRSVPSVGFTFDDGYPDTGAVAWPLLQKYGRSGAVFVIAARTFGDAQSMDIPTLRQLRAQGLRVGLHTMNHTRLKGADDTTLGLEINVAKWLLERHLDAPVNCFAYPYGAYSATAEKRLRAAGFNETYALGNVPDGHVPDRRVPILRADSLFLFKVKLYDLGYDTWIHNIQIQAPQ